MRTIKFRGIDNMSGEMVYGDLVQQELADGSITTAIVQTYATYDVKPDTVGQFTGLYDKNGWGIYEGDIVKLYFPLSDEKDADLHEVRWNDKLGRYELVFICPFNGKENYLLFCDIANMTVVGNIYDNKELLTQTIKQ